MRPHETPITPQLSKASDSSPGRFGVRSTSMLVPGFSLLTEQATNYFIPLASSSGRPRVWRVHSVSQYPRVAPINSVMWRTDTCAEPAYD
jgi:hypothetical protein